MNTEEGKELGRENLVDGAPSLALPQRKTARGGRIGTCIQSRRTDSEEEEDRGGGLDRDEFLVEPPGTIEDLVGPMSDGTERKFS